MAPDLERRVEEWRRAHGDPGTSEVGDHTLSGLPIEPVHTPLDTSLGAVPEVADAYLENLGLPGEPPYTRGVRPLMYREKPWVMGMYSGQASPAETNRRIRQLLAKGQRGFSIALDLPTQNGYDSDHPMAVGEVGKVGVPMCTLRDMEELLNGIPLRDVSQIRTTANAIGPIAAAFFLCAAESHGYASTDFKVMFQNDVLKEYVARGTYIFPPQAGLRFSVDLVEYCATNLPHWEPIEFCGYHVRDSGATAVQELAVALGNGIAYLDEALRRGLSIDQFAHSVFLFLSAHLDIFEEVAKFRAARRLWCRLLEDRYGAEDPASKALNLFAYTLGGALTAQEPLNNVIRVAYQSLAAVLGGVQTLATSSYDEALGLPSDEAVHTALRTQQILAYETGVARTADPLGGSYYVEALTDRVEAAVRDYLAQIERRGGALAVIESGWLQRELNDEAYRQQLAVESDERPVVGVSRFVTDKAARSVRPSQPANDAEEEQLERLRRIKKERSATRVEAALSALRDAAKRGENTVPALLEAARCYATVGEMCGTLTQVWGRHRGSTLI